MDRNKQDSPSLDDHEGDPAIGQSKGIGSREDLELIEARIRSKATSRTIRAGAAVWIPPGLAEPTNDSVGQESPPFLFPRTLVRRGQRFKIARFRGAVVDPFAQ